MKKTLLSLLLLLGALFADGQNQLDLSTVTYASSEPTSTWNFSNGCTISNDDDKPYYVGVNGTIKFPADVTYTIHLPEGFVAKHVVVYGYDNRAGTDAYLSELDGIEFEPTQYVFPQKVDDATTIKTYTITLNHPVSGTLTFKPGGNQVCWSIKLFEQEPTQGFNYSTPATQMESLDRGLVVLPGQKGGRFVCWRLLGTDDYENTSFDIIRDGEHIASDLYGATSYEDPDGTASSIYQVVTKVNGTQTAISAGVSSWANDFKTLTLSSPGEGYTPNDMSVGDVDGDGQYELFLKWDPNNSQDNSINGETGNVFIDCYKVTFGGNDDNLQKMWRVDLGRNIRAGAHYTQFMVYDFDGDGNAEMICKTAPGSIDGNLRFVNEVATDERIKAAVNDRVWVNSTGRVDGGHEYLTVFKGATGEAIHTIAYHPNRNAELELSEDEGTFNWRDDGSTDNHGYNRGERYLAAVAYIDGSDKTPAVVFCRGYYTYAFIWAVKFDGQHLVPQWLHASDSRTSYKLTTYDAEGNMTTTPYAASQPTSGSGSRTMYGNGNHNLSVADVDADGCDEIIWGAAALDNDGKLLYATGFGHGDAIHLADLDPNRPGLEVFDVHEEGGPYSWDVHDAATGEIIFKGGHSGVDNGRGIAAQLEETYRGYYFSSGDDPQQRSAVTGEVVSNSSSSLNFRIYWDGDLQDELFNGTYDKNQGIYTTVTIDDWVDDHMETIKDLPRSLCNGTKSSPCLQADIFGDWREELIVRDQNAPNQLFIYSSNIPTAYRIPTLMHDHVYRMGVAWQNVAYNQPPHVGYYMPDMMKKMFPPQDECSVPEFNIVDMANVDLQDKYPSSSSDTYFLPVVDMTEGMIGKKKPSVTAKFVDENDVETVLEEEPAVSFHSQDYENVQEASNYWVNVSNAASINVVLSDDPSYGNYISLVQGGGTGSRPTYTQLFADGNPFYQTEQYMVEFDLAVYHATGNNKSNDNILMLFGEESMKSASSTNYLFKMTGGAYGSTTYTVEGANQSFSLQDDQWYHYQFTVDKTKKTVEYVITKDDMLIANDTYHITNDNANLNVQCIWMVLGRANTHAWFDNLSIHSIPTPTFPYAFTQCGTLEVSASFEHECKTASFKVGTPYIIDPEADDTENLDNYLPVFVNDELCQLHLEVEETANAHLWRTGIADNSTWASMVLPFNMTREQVKEVFGEQTVVANFVTSGGNSHSVLFETENGSVTANIPFLVKGVTNPSPYLVRNVECNPTMEPKVSSTFFDFIGNYVYAGEPIPFTTSDYFFTTNGLSTVANNQVRMTFYGYRAYFHSLNGNVGNALAVGFDTETAVRDLDADILAPEEVYTITGQRVLDHAGQLRTLPKGVYIVNGKKVTVK